MQNDEYGRLHAAGLHTTARLLLNLWRLMKGKANISCNCHKDNSQLLVLTLL